MQIVYSPRYRIDIGPHVFPTEKFALIHARLIGRGIVAPTDVVEPEPATWEQLALVHTADYLARMRDGTLTDEDIAQLELPWSREMVDGFRLMTGGTIRAASIACGFEAPSLEADGEHSSDFRLETSHVRIGVHIGGGFHHAFPESRRRLLRLQRRCGGRARAAVRGVERIAVIDLDVHHGNGTAFVFESDPRVFTFSMHQQHNYPMWKPRGSLDVGLGDGAHDSTYLARSSARCRRSSTIVRSACSTSPAPIRTRTISWAVCG